ncbi:phage tail sheath subtilisin-like domain-containing protein [Dokdonella sp.]|uniref:phage tail sheath subtilisin-like domain-containing protein n=1 Tax=Dokdonella sp. TaxID=2291710 RepID=UPI0025B8BC33|nr:phage tail sheath subtilisin-like domain-containing protein [Dokdonella sp.]
MLYRELLTEIAASHGVGVHAYALMSNHVHLLASPARLSDLARAMRLPNQRYVSAFSRRHRRIIPPSPFCPHLGLPTECGEERHGALRCRDGKPGLHPPSAASVSVGRGLLCTRNVANIRPHPPPSTNPMHPFRLVWLLVFRNKLLVAALFCMSMPAMGTALPPIEDHYYGATLFVVRTARVVTPPVPVASLASYEAVYGRLADPAADFGYQSARLFFANGGRVLYVIDPRGNTEQHVRSALMASASLPVDLVAMPGLATPGISAVEHGAMIAALIEHVDASANRFGIIDAPQGSDVNALMAFAQTLSSARAALYAPWLDVPIDGGGTTIAMPASAAVAGVVTRIDHDKGIFKAPSGRDAALSTSIDVQLQQAFTQAEQDQLNPASVNVLRRFVGIDGILVWGARTVSQNPEWRYVSVSRFVRLLDFSIRRSLSWVPVAAPRPTSAQISSLIESYFHAYWQRGALMGSTPAQGYFVQCTDSDDTLHCFFGVAPVRPAEFIILQFDMPYDDRLFASGFEA